MRKNVHAVFPVPLTENLLSKLNTLSSQELKILKADMLTALESRVAVFIERIVPVPTLEHNVPQIELNVG